MPARPLRILGLDAALGACSAAVLDGPTVLAEEHAGVGQGQSEVLAPLVSRVLAASGLAATAFDAVAVTLGPGSFTGLRAALALAHGLAAASGAKLVGITVTDALAQRLQLGSRALWVAIDSRRGTIFLDRGEGAESVSLAALPRPDRPIAVAGNAAPVVAATLAAAGADVMLTDVRHPRARDVAMAGAAHFLDVPPGGVVVPLYVDPPEARLPQGGLRPAPA